ncbi:MAG: RNA polymerase sigma-70 factor (ECF subfamily) [Cyclobacteriaceae bacterium]|jgi:RNA polymerase sigma-70 factor (ECF subfamily)
MRETSKIRQLNTSQPFEGYFEDVYTEYFKPLYLYARSLSKSDDLAKDIVSDVFFNLWKSKSDLTKIKELKSYLFRSVKNQVIRTLSNDPRGFDSIDTENYVQQIERVNPEEILLEKELLLIIENAIQKLPDQCRLIFDMAKNKQMKYAEIAVELGVSESTIKTQVSRAVAVLKHAIEEQYNNENSQSVRNYGLSSLILVAILSI